MYAIKVQSYFNAAHNLRGYQGKCEQLHGHNWKVVVEISAARLNKLEMVCDFKEVKKKLGLVLKSLDHSYLNKQTFFKKHNPTSERIAEFIYQRLQKVINDKNLYLTQVCVWETRDSCATFTAQDGLGGLGN